MKWCTVRIKYVTRDFNIQPSGRQQERQKKKKKKKNQLVFKISETSTLFLYISFLFLHDYDVKMPNFASYGARKQATTTFYFSFWAWLLSLEIPVQEGSPPTFDRVSG